MSEQVTDIEKALSYVREQIEMEEMCAGDDAECEGLKKQYRRLEVLLMKLDRLDRLINTPEIEDFVKAVKLEMPHQVERWGASHDQHKNASDWIRLAVHLLGKASLADWAGNREKLKHHVITTAAAMGNFHRAIVNSDKHR